MTKRMVQTSLMMAVAFVCVHGTVTAQARPATRAASSAKARKPFHLTAIFQQPREPGFTAHMTMDWVSPTRWRRTVESENYSQSIVVNGNEVEEEDSSPYMPLEIEALMTAMLRPLLGTPSGAAATVVKTLNAAPFNGRLVPQTLTLNRGEGSGSASVNILELTNLTAPDAGIFDVIQPTSKSHQLRTTELTEPELSRRLPKDHTIIWPQILDGRRTGRETYFISVDSEGTVQEVLPMVNINSRANESAIRQIKRWKFVPLTLNGSPSQFSGLYSVGVNTRAYGPRDPLTDAQVRSLAESTVEPDLPSTIASGSIEMEAVAIDSDGIMVEEIASGGQGDMVVPCYAALRKWKFKPITEHGQPRPYRANIACKAP